MTSESALVSSMKDELYSNLLLHVKTFERYSQLATEEMRDIDQFSVEEAAIRSRYMELGVSDMTFMKTVEDVETVMFENTRQVVDACLHLLMSADPTVQLDAAFQLSNEIFTCYYSKKSIYASQYFQQQRGVNILVGMIDSTWKSNPELCTAVLTAAAMFINSKEQAMAMAETGILPVTVEIMTKTQEPMMKSEAVGLLCGMLDIRSLQLEAVRHGALDPLLQIAVSPHADLHSVVACVQSLLCCASNPDVLDELLESGTVKHLSLLSMSVYIKPKAGPNSPQYIKQKKQCLMIKFLCHVTNCAVITQICRKKWSDVAEGQQGIEEESVVRHIDFLAADFEDKFGLKRAIKLALEWLLTETPEKVRCNWILGVSSLVF